MSEVNLYPRYAESRLLEALADSPVVLIHGPRQCGKTTLARVVGEPRGYLYFIPFPDRFYLFQVKNDPVRHARESGYPVVRRLPGFPPSRE